MAASLLHIPRACFCSVFIDAQGGVLFCVRSLDRGQRRSLISQAWLTFWSTHIMNTDQQSLSVNRRGVQPKEKSTACYSCHSAQDHQRGRSKILPRSCRARRRPTCGSCCACVCLLLAAGTITGRGPLLLPARCRCWLLLPPLLPCARLAGSQAHRPPGHPAPTVDRQQSALTSCLTRQHAPCHDSQQKFQVLGASTRRYPALPVGREGALRTASASRFSSSNPKLSNTEPSP